MDTPAAPIKTPRYIPVITPLPPHHPLPVLKEWQQNCIVGAARPGYTYASAKASYVILPISKVGRRKIEHIGYAAQANGGWLTRDGASSPIRIVFVALIDAIEACRKHYDAA